MSEKQRVKLRASDIDVLLTALRSILKTCLEEELECVDPPIATSHFLSRLGYSDYIARRLWSRIEGHLEIEVFQAKRSKFYIVVEEQKGVAFHDKITGIPLDEIDCYRLRERCMKTSNANKVYLFFAGGVEDNMLRINVVRLMILLEKTTRKAFDLLETVRDLLWREENAEKRLQKILVDIIKSQEHIVVTIEPEIGEIVKTLVDHSPLLRRILSIE